MNEIPKDIAISAKDTAASTRFLGQLPRRARTERLKLWELPNTLHCSIIGTCLSLAELRRTTKRLGLFERVDRMSDHELHAAFVKHADTRNRASNAVQKLLESNHSGLVRRAGRCRTGEELTEFWEVAVAEGQVSGAFWAVMTHPALSDELEIRLFGEVHMMSHLCGASHRADARSVATIERQRNALAERLSLATARHTETLAQRDAELVRLRAVVKGLEPMVRELADLRQRIAGHEAGEEIKSSHREAAALLTRADTAERRLDRVAEDNAVLRALVERLERDNARLRDRVDSAEPSPDRDCLRADLCGTPDLCLKGRCIAYVGGRPQTVSRIRNFVERCNGCLLHHDGGNEQSTFALEGVLRRADVVMFPIDCVSHNAVEKLKSVCERENKAYRPLPSSSFTAFASAVETI